MRRILLLALALIAVLVAWFWLSLDFRVARAIEESASESLGVRVSVTGVDLDLREGRGAIRGVRAANPPGFSDGDLFALEQIEIALAVASLSGEPVRVTEVRIGDARVRIELAADGDSNLGRVVRHLADSGDDAGSGGSRRVAIDALRLDGGRVEVWDADDVKPEIVELARLELREVGGKAGAPGDVLARQIALALARQTAAATAGHELGRAVEKELGGLAGEAAESLLRAILD